MTKVYISTRDDKKEGYEKYQPKTDSSLKLPYEDNSIEEIYSYDYLEKCSRLQTIDILKEFYRVLAPKGILKLLNRDLNWQVFVWQHLPEGHPNKWTEAHDFLFGTPDSPHRTGFTFDLLSNKLKEAGFKKIDHDYLNSGELFDMFNEPVIATVTFKPEVKKPKVKKPEAAVTSKATISKENNVS